MGVKKKNDWCILKGIWHAFGEFLGEYLMEEGDRFLIDDAGFPEFSAAAFSLSSR